MPFKISVLNRDTTSHRPSCSSDQFACAGGLCVPSSWLCDGVSDCLLGDDESSFHCGTLFNCTLTYN